MAQKNIFMVLLVLVGIMCFYTIHVEAEVLPHEIIKKENSLNRMIYSVKLDNNEYATEENVKDTAKYVWKSVEEEYEILIIKFFDGKNAEEAFDWMSYATAVFSKEKLGGFNFHNVPEEEIEELKAFKTLYFKDTKEEVKQKIKSTTGLHSTGFSDAAASIANTYYYIFFDYYKNELYRLSFNGTEYTAEYFDTKLKEERNVLVSIIEQKYGAPSIDRQILFFEMDDGYINWSHIWNLNNKKIKIGLLEYDYKYSVIMDIEYTPIVVLVEAAKNNKDSEIIEESSNDF